MKKVIIGGVILAIVIAAGLYFKNYKISNDQDQNGDKPIIKYDETTIPKVVDDFYQNYENCLKNPPSQAAGKVSEYCQNNTGLTSAAFAANLEKGGVAKAGADPIFCAQIAPESMKASSDFQIKNNKASGFMEEKFGSNEIKTQIHLVNEKDVWKVDNVICPVPASILPADNEFPAAGICAEAGEEDIVRVEVNQDTPSPRCQKVVAGKRLVVKNNTGEMLSMWFGKNKEYFFSVSANGEYAIPRLVDKLLAPGVHSFHGTPYQGPEIWLVTTQNSNGILPYDSGVSGTVLLGPTCPVVKDPPDPACADKPFKTTIQVIAINSPKSSPFATAETDAQGRYKIMLPPGEYALQPVGRNPLPRCETKSVIIEPKLIKETNLSCDTGIR